MPKCKSESSQWSENHAGGKSADLQQEPELSVRVQEVRKTPHQHSAVNRTFLNAVSY